ncbi:hypothetical protein CHU00_17685 [Sphingobacterium cellulitidis]|uniref:hypothetical protein n=1 Tax=Sphingobacterium cellulitidis TaxID=1768011 RepID=UPI000B93A55C|nr:hypothetical protein [Sphingobacterium cellulitidis]OYD44273.1 hypothetical protein CHU00_17685 [Sphingobacterium cellulitidis]
MNELFDELERLIKQNKDGDFDKKEDVVEGDKRNFRWCIRLRKSEFKRLHELSEKLKISKSDLGRNLLFYKARIPKMSQEQRELMMDIANLRTAFSRISNYMKYDLDIKLRAEIADTIHKIEVIYKNQIR